jgi:hypothetical protein
MLAFLPLTPPIDPEQPRRRKPGNATTALPTTQKRTRSFANILLPLGWLGFIAWLMLLAIRANVLYALERQKFRSGGEKY